MALECDCEKNDNYIGEYRLDGFATLQHESGHHCMSCGKLIEIGDNRLKFEQILLDGNESKLFPYPVMYHCEDCGNIAYMFAVLGFCMGIDDNMQELLKEYQQKYAHESWKKPSVEPESPPIIPRFWKYIKRIFGI